MFYVRPSGLEILGSLLVLGSVTRLIRAPYCYSCYRPMYGGFYHRPMYMGFCRPVFRPRPFFW